jgi:hypothetical protein
MLIMRNLKPYLIAFASVLALGTGTAIAQGAGQVPSFEEMDRDGDGYISHAEAMALPCVGDNYDAIAPRSDRGLGRLEYQAAVQRFCQ